MIRLSALAPWCSALSSHCAMPEIRQGVRVRECNTWNRALRNRPSLSHPLRSLGQPVRTEREI
jgi:hypothetical protein